MIRACIDCGEPTQGVYCDDCRRSRHDDEDVSEVMPSGRRT